MPLWEIFTQKPPKPTGPPDAIIYDSSGGFPVDKAYADMGEREGWLKFTGWEYDSHGKVIYTFSFIG